MSAYEMFKKECDAEITAMGEHLELRQRSQQWINLAQQNKYSYHFEWLGRPIIQYPQDIVAMQEIIWRTQPDLIIETGIAHGGSLIFSASMLALNAICGGNPEARVVGVDIDIRQHNREAIAAHPLAQWITMIEGSSIAADVVEQVRALAAGRQKILVCLDSNHTHEHVLAELEVYAPMTSVGSYCVVFDTVIEDMPVELFHDRPWGPGDNPKTAVFEWLRKHPEFVCDDSIEHKLQVTVAPGGYLKRIG